MCVTEISTSRFQKNYSNINPIITYKDERTDQLHGVFLVEGEHPSYKRVTDAR